MIVASIDAIIVEQCGKILSACSAIKEEGVVAIVGVTKSTRGGSSGKSALH
jgi:hypothetical protein